ncbi:hypothetical protein JRO89_XS03G0145300 [Xanthoceras sorbifolium]|uniref:Uncharacterized protein n=1 Tax=Xanthoceras sorbifolium TaxID=99658 RepID=A0ABQ8IAV6_9ROSI|nr:hypothetical protein JRO89_XS03G0145300 [Xanthoceras sorbifolium]
MSAPATNPPFNLCKKCIKEPSSVVVVVSSGNSITILVLITYKLYSITVEFKTGKRDIEASRTLFKQHYGRKSEKDSTSDGGKKENRVPSKLLTRVVEENVTSKLFQLGVIAFTDMSNGVIADPSADPSTVASSTIHAVAASYSYSGSSYDIGIHAF